ncbi:MAG: hypothetical protein JW795_23135 [Chitinivibrionales bacterium]|nr:hypothetical protein [Chitinivibrionales bacterium]
MGKTHLQFFSGTLLDKYGNVIAGRDVWLRIKGTDIQFKANPTSIDGQFCDEKLPPGLYEILVSDESIPGKRVVGVESHCPADLLYKQVAWVKKSQEQGKRPTLILGLQKKDGKEDVYVDPSGKSVYHFSVHFFNPEENDGEESFQQWHGIEARRENYEIVLRLPNATVLTKLNDNECMYDAVKLNRQFLVVQAIRDDRYLPLRGGTMEGPIFLNYTLGNSSGDHPEGRFSHDLIHARNDYVISTQKTLEINAGVDENNRPVSSAPGSIKINTNGKQAIFIDKEAHVGVGPASGGAAKTAAVNTVPVNTVPVNTVDINGNAVIGTAYFGQKIAPSNGLLVEGKVGINTDAAALLPDEQLRVEGCVRITDAFGIAEGINTKEPKNSADIQGNVAIGEKFYGTVNAPANGLLVEGDVGIGVAGSMPKNKLDVQGGVAIGGDFYGQQPAPENGLIVQGKVGINTTKESILPGDWLLVTGGARVTDRVGIAEPFEAKEPVNQLDVQGKVVIGSSLYGMIEAPDNGLQVEGAVGIGVGIGSSCNRPLNKLDVQGNAVFGNNYFGNRTAPKDGVLIEGKVGINTGSESILAGERLRIHGSVRITEKAGIAEPEDAKEPKNQLEVKGNAAIGGDFYGSVDAPESGMLVQGAVGIGTAGTAPANKLDIQGNTVIGADYYGSRSAPVNGLLVEGKVGINTSSEALLSHDQLRVHGNIRVTEKIGIADSGDPHEPLNSFDVKGAAAVGALFYATAQAPENGMLVQGDVGIGSSGALPANKVDVQGSMVVGADYYGSSKAPENGLLVEGKVGINTSADSMSQKTMLRVHGSARITETLGIAEANQPSDPQNRLDVAGSAVIGSSFYGSKLAPMNGLLVEGAVGFGPSGAGPVNTLDVQGNVVIGTDYHATQSAPANGLLVEGKVGINTTTASILPGDWLRVHGSVRATDAIGIAEAADAKEPVNMLDIKGNVVIGKSLYGSKEAPESGLLVQGNVGIGSSGVLPSNSLDVQGNAVIGTAYHGNKKAPENGLLVEGKVGIGTDVIADRVKLHVQGVVSVATPQEANDAATKKYVDHRFNIGIFGPGKLSKLGTGPLPGRVVLPVACKVISLRAYVNEKSSTQVKFHIKYRKYVNDSNYEQPRSIRTDEVPFTIGESKHCLQEKDASVFLLNGFSEADILELSIVDGGSASDLTVTIECCQP